MLLPSQVSQLTDGFLTTIVNAATGTGTGKSTPFVVQRARSGQPRHVEYQCSGTYTVCTVTLQQSADGGTTFKSVGAAFDVYANPAGDLAIMAAIVAFVHGMMYQLSVTSITGTSVTIKVAQS